MLMQDKASDPLGTITLSPNPASEQKDSVFSQHPEAEVWHAFKAGNEQAFAYIYNLHVHALYNYGYRITPHRELVEDCIQDLFVNLWHNRKSLGDTTTIKFYLFKALKRSLIKKVIIQRKRATKVELLEQYNVNMILSPEFELIAEQISQRQKEKLLITLNNLSQRQKEAIILKFFDDLSYQEVALLMSMSVKSTYNLIYRAINVLKINVEKFYLILFISNLY
jgi:RNA polymerase sigma factor (sigma-70 family)